MSTVPTCPPGFHLECVPDAPTPPQPPSGGIIENGVKMLYPKIGEAITGKYSSNNAGRFQWIHTLPKCFVNIEFTGYLRVKKTYDMGEEVSLKVRGGRHTSSDPQLGSCYIIGINYDGGVNSQYESPHPNNKPMPFQTVTSKPLGSNIIGKWFGIKAICYLEGDHDKIECWIDTGGLKSDGTPANNWVKFWQTTSKLWTGKCSTSRTPQIAFFRIDDVSSSPQTDVEIKFATAREIVVR